MFFRGFFKFNVFFLKGKSMFDAPQNPLKPTSGPFRSPHLERGDEATGTGCESGCGVFFRSFGYGSKPKVPFQ